jgi:hypothetical protein
LWLVSQIVTDIVRKSAFADYARGWSMIGLTLINFAVLYTLLYERPRRLVIYGWGLVAGGVLLFFLSPNDASAGLPWKFGFAFPVSLAVFLVTSSEKIRRPLADYAGCVDRRNQHLAGSPQPGRNLPGRRLLPSRHSLLEHKGQGRFQGEGRNYIGSGYFDHTGHRRHRMGLSIRGFRGDSG